MDNLDNTRKGVQARVCPGSHEPLRTPESGPTAEPAYLTARQVAELLQVAEKTVYGWITAEPTMPVLKLGGTVRFPRERLMRWLRDREQGHGRPRMRKQVLAVAKPTTGQEGPR